MSKDINDNPIQDAFRTLFDESEIKALIKARGWSQKDIAEYWGMTPKWVSALIKNKNGERTHRDDCAFRGLPNKIEL